jgi:adenylate cyclase
VTAARRLAAILAADVVGYSRLMGKDEAGTAKLVRERRETATVIVRSFGGRLVKTMGDGVLLEFPSVVAAVVCAIAIQKMMVERNATVPEAKRILYRVGINLGDVLIDGDDILGDGVNIAARLEGICEAGGICLSEDAYRQARGRIEAEFVDLGEQVFKNIAHPVRAYALTPTVIATVKAINPPSTVKAHGSSFRWPVAAAALATVAVLTAGGYAWHARLAPAPRLSIVVLPFENLSGDPDQGYFADGIADDLTTDLSHLPDSFVISRSTAFTYKGKPVDAKQIGRELGVRFVLEGSVRRVGETVTINAQLISTDTGAHVWANRFEGERSKLGQLQVEFVSSVAGSLGAVLVKAESLRAMRERPDNPDAVDLAMQGETILQSNRSKANFDEAINLFERALALDAHNVRAMRDLAYTLTRRVNIHWSEDPTGDLARAYQAIGDALELERDNSEGHRIKGMVLAAQRQWRSAIAEAELAIALDPNNARAHADAGAWKMFLGRSEDGFAGLDTAFLLSPRDSAAPVWQLFVCDLHAMLAHWELAIEWCSKAAAGAPQDWYPLAMLAAANAWAGRDKEAKDATAQLQKLYPGFTVQKWAGIHWSDDPTFNAQYQRLVEGLRKAGLPEGLARTN